VSKKKSRRLKKVQSNKTEEKDEDKEPDSALGEVASGQKKELFEKEK